MSIRPILCVSLLLCAAACTMPGTQEAQPTWKSTQYTPLTPARPVPSDPMKALVTDSSVTVFPLSEPIHQPFSDKQLQPLSQKVLGEGYPVLDTSVTVYPLNPPRAIPNVAFENVAQTSADSSLYSARVQALAAQRPPEEDMGDMVPFPALPSTRGAVSPASAHDVIGAARDDIQASTLPPIEGPAIAVEEPVYTPVKPAQPPESLFTKPGAKIGPKGHMGNAPVVPAKMAPIAEPMPAPKAPPMPAPKPMPAPMPAPAPAKAPVPIPDDAAMAMPPPKPREPDDAWVPPPAVPAEGIPPLPADMTAIAPPAVKPEEPAEEIIPMPPIPSLTGY